MRFVLMSIFTGSVVAVVFPRLASADESRPPNIVLVFIDDMGWADFSCFGNEDAQTPNIDRMAAEGIAFEQFYVNSPICSPSRVAISTGQYPQRWRITSYLAHRKQNAERGMANWLDPKAPMLARSLKKAGYATGHFGKWHMGGQRDVDEAPSITIYGFDQSLTNFEGIGPKLLPATMRPGWEKPRRIWVDAERLGGPVTWMQRSEITGGFVDAAIKFAKTAHANKKPFYVNVWPDDVHSPYFPPVEKWGNSKRALYLAVLEEMDRQLGPLFQYIRDEETLRDNTFVLMCSDNGHEPGAGQAGPLKGCKTNLYEGGIRSSLIAWGPGLMSKDALGTRNGSSVFCAIDLAPSLLELSGAPKPGGVKYDGEQLLGTLLGKESASRQAPIFFSRPPDRKNFYGFEGLPDLAVRESNWKLLCDYDGSRPELYDLVTDVGERNNIAADHPDVVKRLAAAVVAWWNRMPTAAAKTTP
jgi:arylsulfatase A-like enzyme